MNKVKLPNNKSSSESFRKLRYIEGQGRGNIVLFQTQRNVDLIIFHSFSPLHIWPAIRGWWNPELSTDRCLSSSCVLTDPVTPRPPSLMESRATHMTPSKMADQPLFQLSYGGLDSVLRYQERAHVDECTCMRFRISVMYTNDLITSYIDASTKEGSWSPISPSVYLSCRYSL